LASGSRRAHLEALSRLLLLSGYPQLAREEDFAASARRAGIEYGPLLQRILSLGRRFEPSAAG
jgi:hypothetical protein